MNDPRIPALLVSHRRPGFYFRVLEEGEVQAGDEILKLETGPEEMTVAEVSALLYLPGHPRQQLLRALRIPALSPGWQESFRALLDGEAGGGNAGLATASPPPAWPGFRRLAVTAIERESDSVISIRFEDPDGEPLPAARPGQYLTLRIQPDEAERPLLRNYSLCGPPGRRLLPDRRQARARRRRERLPAHAARRRRSSSTSQRRAAPSSSTRSDAPVLLISAGIGATPVLAMLNALAEEHSEREIWWLHGARNGREHSFAAESAGSARGAPERTQPRLLQPARRETTSKVATTTRPAASTAAVLAELEPPRDARGIPVRPDGVHGRRSAPASRRWASTPRASTPSCSGPNRA